MRDALEWIERWLPVYYDRHGHFALPLVGIGLVLARFALARRSGARVAPALRIVLGAILAATVLFSIVVYNNFFNYHYGGYLNPYEFFHYYLGSKFAREIGYFDMYGAALVADGETGRIYWPDDGAITDLRTSRHVPLETVLAEGARYRALFSEERWQEWTGDVFWFKKRMGSAAWNRILHDRGYNATPVWTALVGSTLSGRVKTSNEAGMTALALLDVLLLAVAAAAVARTFGLWPAGLMVVLLASSYLMAHVHMKGAFLRTDFVVSLVLAVCLLRARRHTLAGALVGCSTMSRLFPAVFLFGPAVKMAWEVFAATRSARGGGLARLWAAVDRRHRRFFGGFTVAVVVLFALSVLPEGGVGRWGEFAQKIRVHRADYHPWNVGLPSVVAGDPDGGEAHLPPGAVERRRLLIDLIGVAALVLCVFAVRGLDDPSALAFGFVPLYFLIAPTYYYYIVLLVPFLFLAERWRRRAGALGLAYLFFVGLVGHWLYERYEQRFPTYYWSSVLALGLALLLVAVALGESRRARSQGATSMPSPASPTG